MAGGAAEVDRQRVAALLARPVDGAERDDEAAERAPLPPRRRPSSGPVGQVGHQLVEGVGYVERRQPDLVGRRAVAAHPVDGDVEQRLGLAGAGLDGDRLRLGLGGVEALHLGDRERQDAADVAALVAADPHPAGWRPGDVGRLEPQQRGRVGLEVAEAGIGGQLVGVGHAEHGARLRAR